MKKGLILAVCAVWLAANTSLSIAHSHVGNHIIPAPPIREERAGEIRQVVFEEADSPTSEIMPAAGATPGPAPAPTPHPMSIQALRGRGYPGSRIEIIQELTEAAGYRRYLAAFTSDGLKIYALLTVPKGPRPENGWPAVVFLHGYIPPQSYRTTELYTAHVDRLARAGYIVFRIDLRGHGDSEGEAAGAYRDPGYTVDALNAVGALKSYPQADPGRIGMWGHSMGGYLALRSMVVSPDIKAGVSWAGVVGSQGEIITEWKQHTKPSPSDPDSQLDWQKDWLSCYGTPEENPGFWDSVSATAHLEDLSGPLLLIHSPQDEVVPAVFSRRLAERIEAAGGETEWILYPGDDHDLRRHFSAAVNATVAFFDRFLKE